METDELIEPNDDALNALVKLLERDELTPNETLIVAALARLQNRIAELEKRDG